MSSQVLGKNTLKAAEVQGITAQGIWLFVKEREYFLAYQDFPWFQDARVKDIYHLEFSAPHHLYWPDLDVDLELESLEHPERYPLTYKK